MKTVLFTQRVEIIESYGERRDCADQRIAEFIAACGCLPVPLPNNGKSAGKYAGELSPAGIILTGGNSLCRYGGSAPERDEMDRSLVDFAVYRNIPLYGFCRGMQSVLDYFGESLQEVRGHTAVRHGLIWNPKYYKWKSESHKWEPESHKREPESHKWEPESHKWEPESHNKHLPLPEDANSYHNQGCMKLTGSSLIWLAKTEDGVIEAVRHKELPIYGTMWHPEREQPFREADLEFVKMWFHR